MATQSAGKSQQPSIGDQLSEAYRLLESGKPQDALEIVKKVKSLQPKNVYVLAFEKQLEQFISLEGSQSLTEEQRADILESIPGIIERAAEGAAVEKLSAERDETATVKTRDDKNAALEWLKDQYFQHAHEYVQKEQYEHALAEIRRVYIIDADNVTAQEFEKRIEHLIALKTQPVPPATSGAPTLRLVTKESLRESEEASGPTESAIVEPSQITFPPFEGTTTSPDELEKIIVKTEEWSAPTATPTAPEPTRKPAKDIREKRKGIRPAVIVVSLFLIIAVGAAIFMFWTRNQTDKRAEARRSTTISTSQPETFTGPQTTVEEQTITIEPQTDESKNQTPQVEAEKPAPEKGTATKPESKSRKGGGSTGKRSSQRSDPTSSLNAGESPPLSPTRDDPPATPATTSETNPPVNLQEPAPQNPTVAQEKAAEIVKLARIEFPQDAAFDQYQGQVVLQVHIDADGNPLETKIASATNQLLVTPVINAVMKSQFSPARTSDGPVASWMTIPFRVKR